MLLPQQLHDLWQAVERGQLTATQATADEERLRGNCREIWREALLLPGHEDLTESLLSEVSLYLGEDIAEVRRRCKLAVTTISEDWQKGVNPGDKQAIEQFYDESTAYIYDLMWWHTLQWDDSPLAYIIALDFAKARQCRSYLDFGTGVGS
jgi:hypothetical protein